MTELKTLKDLSHIKVDRVRFDKSYEGDFYLSDCIAKEDLKQEAIKWVKHFEDIPGCQECGTERTQEAFKEFFNISEEDLK